MNHYDYPSDPYELHLMSLFVEDYLQHLNNYLSQFTTNNAHNISWEKLQHLLHRLKGGAGAFGLEPISMLASQIEKQVIVNESSPKQHEIKDLQVAIENLKHYFDLLQDELKNKHIDSQPTEMLCEQKFSLVLLSKDQELTQSMSSVFTSTYRLDRVLTTVEDTKKHLAENHCDVVVIDLEQEPEQRYALAREITGGALRQSSGSGKVVVVSEYLTLKTRQSAHQAGAIGLFTKPIDAHGFRQWLELIVCPLRAPPTILVIDDDQHFVALLQQAMVRNNIKVVPLLDPLKFFDQVIETRPNLIILDIGMPTIDGMELFALIQADPQLCFIPTVILTGHDDPEMQLRAWDLGADDFITKTKLDEMLPRLKARLRDAVLRQGLTQTDVLTGVGNRRYLEEQLERLITLAKRQQTALSCGMLDIDHFKKVNDEFGHHCGDMVLRELGHLLKSRFRTSDVICRYGGEEFVVLLLGTEGEPARLRLDDLRQRFSEIKFTVPETGQSFSVSFSIGVSLLSSTTQSGEDLITAADHALYQAKQSGRNCTVVG